MASSTSCLGSNEQSLQVVTADASDTVVRRFERAVASHGQQPAVVDGAVSLSYAELDAVANGVAQAILRQSGDSRAPVTLFLEHNYCAICAILGALKTGRAYCALDVTAPPTRLFNQLNDLQADILLTTKANEAVAQAAAAPGQSILLIETLQPQSVAWPVPPLTAATPAVILYTSGTTGTPRGIVRTHGDLLRRVDLDTYLMNWRAEDNISMLYGCSFAGSISDLFGALLNGATLHILDVRVAGIKLLMDWLAARRITVMHINATLLGVLLDHLPPDAVFPDLRLVRPSQRLLRRDVKRLWAHLPADSLIVHQYASTEAGLISRLELRRSVLPNGDILPVGLPAPGVELMILDANGEPAPPQTFGEIVVRSPYLTRTIWRGNGLAEAAPIDADTDQPFHTGDFGLIRADGLLELAGRRDAQVKVRGYRVELKAIEAVLARQPGVRQAAVVAQTTRHGDRRLIGYVAVDGQLPTTTDDLRRGLASQLPTYMMPARLVLLASMPTLANGKIDRAMLPPLGKARPDLDAPFVAPRNEVEQQIADIWADLLELDEVGVEDDFFELGGDSIAAMSMLLKVEQSIGCTISRDFLRNPTIANIARLSMGESEILSDPMPADNVNTEPVLPKPTPRRLRSQLRRLAERLESRILEHALNMPYQEGMAWLRRWAGQPLMPRIRYFRERRLYREFAANFDSPLSDDRHAFVEAILNNIWGVHIRQMARRRPVAEYTAALQGSRWRFWRDFGNQLAASLVDPTAPAPYDIVGGEILDDVVRQGRGVILVEPHLPALGAYKVILASLGIFPYAITGAAFDRAHAELTAAEHISAGAPHLQVQHAHELLRAWELLRQGEVLYIPIDTADGVGPRIYTPVGRRLFPFHIGAIELALATGAPLLPMTTLLQPDNRLRLTIAAPLSTGDLRMGHDERLWITAQACGKFLESLWRDAPFARTWGDMAHFLGVTRSPAEISPGQWIDFAEREGRHA